MHLLSYRGPAMAGGVSGTFASLWDAKSTYLNAWSFLEGESVCQVTDFGRREIATISPKLLDSHYRFCNEFIWPVMHDMPERVRFVEADYNCYKIFNRSMAANMLTANAEDELFIQDYQFALMPSRLAASSDFKSMLFWHIPWPKQVAPEHLRPVQDITRAMLDAQVIGFHTDEYANNFLNFVRNHLPNCTQLAQRLLARHHQSVVVRPLGVPTGLFKADDATTGGDNPQALKKLLQSAQPLPYILSIDRADYTKGIKERLRAIRAFFTLFPSWRGKIVFVQLCAPTRSGLIEFDQYWQECEAMGNALNLDLSSGDWHPLIWVKSSLGCEQLVELYRNARAMLVNPIRDGLNLTAKEFVQAQRDKDPGVLFLSSGAGAFVELGEHCVAIKPQDTLSMAAALHHGLRLSKEEREERMHAMKTMVERDNLNSWWDYLAAITDQLSAGSSEVVQLNTKSKRQPVAIRIGA